MSEARMFVKIPGITVGKWFPGSNIKKWWASLSPQKGTVLFGEIATWGLPPDGYTGQSRILGTGRGLEDFTSNAALQRAATMVNSITIRDGWMFLTPYLALKSEIPDKFPSGIIDKDTEEEWFSKIRAEQETRNCHDEGYWHDIGARGRKNQRMFDSLYPSGHLLGINILK
jgi:hypothetical protein